jgi:hypothetical protein
MRRILLSCAILGVLTLPAAAAFARADAVGKADFLVVRKAAGDGSATGAPVVTLVMRRGFVLGRVRQQSEARVDVYQLPSQGGQAGGARAVGPEVSSKTVRGHRFIRREFKGVGFRFRALGDYFRVVVRGSGIYLFAGGQGRVKLHGSSLDPGGDGTYSIGGAAFRSLPAHVLKRRIGRG